MISSTSSNTVCSSSKLLQKKQVIAKKKGGGRGERVLPAPPPESAFALPYLLLWLKCWPDFPDFLTLSILSVKSGYYCLISYFQYLFCC